MVFRRLGYAAALAGALLAFFLSSGYFACYLLLLLLLLPVLSLAVSRLLVRRVSLTLSPVPARLERDEALSFRLSVQGNGGLVTRVTGTLEVENRLTGQKKSARWSLPSQDGTCALSQSGRSDHCGLVVCTVKRARVWDLMGLFSWPVTLPAPAAGAVFPRFLEGKPMPELERPSASLRLRPRPGGGPGEDYELRDYRPGDPLRTIHWKCSAKREDLVVREVLEPTPSAVALTFDRSLPPAVLDAVLDRVQALSRRLIAAESPHFLVWMEGDALQWAAVSSSDQLTAALMRLFSRSVSGTPASLAETPVAIPGYSGQLRPFHVTPDLWQEGGAL
ncbi:DUF58 domain-containing protein [Pseudoflavonifractor phocaeensis]|uniref:DUF58 domain-containing protein n=1 Tax=Pseudoflavonifractor phocaeensis TaxID=1870988 RepID=UPI00195A9FDD|nr:DUF58 domain-containing protein [Pseudoflavonifractor phocaeensis]MBM6938685.1 DUF58 domain-containing protein [Pseudoflavonifractor phocaeensis]